jgi:glycosyltransferase involved in cell wall biosynthesis
MYTPTADGGHARYTWELMTALTRQFGPCFELVTSEDVDARFRDTTYPVHPILPRIIHRNELSNKIAWAANRLTHYPRCEKAFLNWLASRPDISGVHFQEHTAWRATAFFNQVRELGKRVYYTVHNVHPHSYPPFISPRLVDRWNRQAYQACDGLFVLSPRLREELKYSLNDIHPPISVAPHGVWTVRDAVETSSLGDRLGSRRLLFFGAIRQNKGLDILLKALRLLPGFSLTIAGEPREREYFETRILPEVDRLRQAGFNIELIPRYTPDDEVGKLFASSGALILPYTDDFKSQSGVAFMSLAYQLPVVASKAGGLKDLFDRFTIGTQFDKLDPEELAGAILELTNSNARELDSQMRAARQTFSWSNAAEATAELYALEPLATRRAA